MIGRSGCKNQAGSSWPMMFLSILPDVLAFYLELTDPRLFKMPPPKSYD